MPEEVDPRAAAAVMLEGLAKLVGARVIRTVSTEKKAAVARWAGADDTINYQ